MNYKLFVEKVDEKLSSMSIEDLRTCIHAIARKTSEVKREEFIQMLDVCSIQDDRKVSSNKHIYIRRMEDEKVKYKLSEINDVFSKIRDGELYISASGYEDYSNGYWSSEWIWEYNDNEGIGKIIEDAIIFAHDCMNDCRYEEAISVFKLVMDTGFHIEDVGGDSFELNLEEMEDEGLARVNLEVIALDVLYTEYNLQPSHKRADMLYSYFEYPYFKNIHIEDIFSIGREELKDTDMFFQSWINVLKKQQGDIASRLLREGILYYKGVDGLEEEARIGYKEHPGIYLDTLLEYEKMHEYEKMKEVGKEALDKLGKNLKIRGEIAIKTAQASASISDNIFARKCLYEAFYSDSTVINFLRLFTDKESICEYKAAAEKRIENLKIEEYYNKKVIFETAENTVAKKDYKYLHFFSGHFNKVKDWCMEQNSPIGWSGEFIGHGVDLMLLYLFAGDNIRRAGMDIAERVSSTIGLNDIKNLVLFDENSIFKTEVSEQNTMEIFWNVFCLWKSNYIISNQEIMSYVDWLELVIDMRINGIVGGKYRNKYDDVALLAAALGEVKESLGEINSKKFIMDKYTKKYSRHTSFKGALRGYID